MMILSLFTLIVKEPFAVQVKEERTPLFSCGTSKQKKLNGPLNREGEPDLVNYLDFPKTTNSFSLLICITITIFMFSEPLTGKN